MVKSQNNFSRKGPIVMEAHPVDSAPIRTSHRLAKRNASEKELMQRLDRFSHC